MLSNFQFQGKPLVQTFLLGQNQLRTRISSMEFEQLRQRITAVHHLDALNVNETKEYIEHRLRCVGWTDDPAISNAAFLAIHEATAGVPRRINNVCDRVLLFGFLEGLHQIDEAAVQSVVDEMKSEYGEIGERADIDPGAPFDRPSEGSPALRSGASTGFAQADIGELTAAVRELTGMLRDEFRAMRTLLAPGSVPASEAGLASDSGPVSVTLLPQTSATTDAGVAVDVLADAAADVAAKESSLVAWPAAGTAEDGDLDDPTAPPKLRVAD